MNRIFKLVHLVSLSVFLGSIITFILISVMIENNTPENTAFGRNIILKGTNTLILPAMWCLALTGLLMGFSRIKTQKKFITTKLVLAILVILNAHFFITPAVNMATDIAMNSLFNAQANEEYWAAYKKESFFGALNVLMILFATAAAIWHTKFQRQNVS